MYDLFYLTNKWLQPKLLKLAQMIQHNIRHTDPMSVDELVSLVEQHTATEKYLKDLPNKSVIPENRNISTSDKNVSFYGRSQNALI